MLTRQTVIHILTDLRHDIRIRAIADDTAQQRSRNDRACVDTIRSTHIHTAGTATRQIIRKRSAYTTSTRCRIERQSRSTGFRLILRNARHTLSESAHRLTRIYIHTRHLHLTLTQFLTLFFQTFLLFRLLLRLGISSSLLLRFFLFG